MFLMAEGFGDFQNVPFSESSKNKHSEKRSIPKKRIGLGEYALSRHRPVRSK